MGPVDSVGGVEELLEEKQPLQKLGRGEEGVSCPGGLPKRMFVNSSRNHISGGLLGLTGWISLQSKRLSRVFSNTTVQKHQFCSALAFW